MEVWTEEIGVLLLCFFFLPSDLLFLPLFFLSSLFRSFGVCSWRWIIRLTNACRFPTLHLRFENKGKADLLSFCSLPISLFLGPLSVFIHALHWPLGSVITSGFSVMPPGSVSPLVLWFFSFLSPPVCSSPLFFFWENQRLPHVHSFSFSFLLPSPAVFFLVLSSLRMPCGPVLSVFNARVKAAVFFFFRVKKMNSVEVILRFGPWCFESFVIKPLG